MRCPWSCSDRGRLDSEVPQEFCEFQAFGEEVKNQNAKERKRASLVAQWLRVCLPMQETWVRALVWEDPTYRGATKAVRHNF